MRGIVGWAGRRAGGGDGARGVAGQMLLDGGGESGGELGSKSEPKVRRIAAISPLGLGEG